MSKFPQTRLRRLRKNESLRNMLDITIPGPEKFIWPVFVIDGENKREPIEAMPKQNRLSIDCLIEDLKPLVKTGIGGILIFGVLDEKDKDEKGSVAWDEQGIVQKAVKAVRKSYPDMLIFTDVCLCAYTEHGHCGILDMHGTVDNDQSNEALSRVAISHANAGADAVAPSAMMDGQVAAIRYSLDSSGFQNTIIMSYSTKFSSSLYDPFRDAEKSAPQFGDRKTYQEPYGDIRQALRESRMDEEEGADILMVKPAIFYLDVLCKMRAETDLPIAAYNVSGEYAMLVAQSERGWGNLKKMVTESTTAIARAGADIIISYWANQYDEIFDRR